MPCHPGCLIVQDDVGEVLTIFNRVGNRRHPAVEEGGIPHKDNLLIPDKWIDAGTSSAPERHCQTDCASGAETVRISALSSNRCLHERRDQRETARAASPYISHP